VYNTTQSVTNSKTYYLIYSGGGLNSNLNSPLVTDQIGTQIASGTPIIQTASTQTADVIIQDVGTPIDRLSGSAITGIEVSQA
jgi:hypothetical protein